MRRMVVLFFALLPVVALSTGVTVVQGTSTSTGYGESLCQHGHSVPRPVQSIGENGEYIGPRRADGAVPVEPARVPAQRRDLHDDAAEEPAAAAEPGRHRRHLGLPAAGDVLARHDDVRHASRRRSSPTRARRTATRTRGPSPNPKSPNYIGKHPGNAFMEVQFYSPGYVPQFDGFGCSATQYCATLTIDSLSDQPQHRRSAEQRLPHNHFLVGRSRSTGRTSPRAASRRRRRTRWRCRDDPNADGPQPRPDQGPADEPRRHDPGAHARHAGRVRVDITTSPPASGSMTASIANGFGQVLFQPNAKQCHVAAVRVPPDVLLRRAARQHVGGARQQPRRLGRDRPLRVLRRDRRHGSCTSPGRGDTTLDADDRSASTGTPRRWSRSPGCFARRRRLRRAVLPARLAGDVREPAPDRKLHETPMRFTVPTSDGKALEKVAFENDLPRIERGEPGNASRSATR